MGRFAGWTVVTAVGTASADGAETAVVAGAADGTVAVIADGGVIAGGAVTAGRAVTAGGAVVPTAAVVGVIDAARGNGAVFLAVAVTEVTVTAVVLASPRAGVIAAHAVARSAAAGHRLSSGCSDGRWGCSIDCS